MPLDASNFTVKELYEEEKNRLKKEFPVLQLRAQILMGFACATLGNSARRELDVAVCVTNCLYHHVNNETMHATFPTIILLFASCCRFNDMLDLAIGHDLPSQNVVDEFCLRIDLDMDVDDV